MQAVPLPILTPDALDAGAFARLEDTQGRAVALERCEIRAEVAFPIAHLTLDYVFENRSDDDIETTYTMPIALDSTLVSLVAQIGERAFTGRVMQAVDAEQTYERAIEDGHSAPTSA